MNAVWRLTRSSPPQLRVGNELPILRSGDFDALVELFVVGGFQGFAPALGCDRAFEIKIFFLEGACVPAIAGKPWLDTKQNDKTGQ